MPETIRTEPTVNDPVPTPGPVASPAAARRPADPPDAHAAIPDLPRISPVAITMILLVLAALFTAAFFLGWIPHQRRLEAAVRDAREVSDSRPVVEVVAPHASPADEQLLLSADVRANQATAIFARTNGYLKPAPPGVDIGARVQAGQIIAEIAAPEIDAQLEQAVATLDQARSVVKRMEQEYDLKLSTLTHFEAASEANAVSRQELDEKRTQEKTSDSALSEARTNVAVAQASVKRYTELQTFQRIIAPFSGVITARGFDSGALISSGDSGGGRELFRIEDTQVLRVQVNVPQDYATVVQPGRPAELLVRNFPGRAFKGVVARSSGAIDPATRTLRVEVDVPNSDGTLMPGMYGQVRIQCHRDQAPLLVPAGTLAFGAEGVRVAALDGSHARFRPVTLGRDLGAEVEIVSGLQASDLVVINPGSLADGAEVVVLKR